MATVSYNNLTTVAVVPDVPDKYTYTELVAKDIFRWMVSVMNMAMSTCTAFHQQTY